MSADYSGEREDLEALQVSQEDRETKDHKVFRDDPDPPENKDLREKPGPSYIQDLIVIKAPTDHPVSLAYKDLIDLTGTSWIPSVISLGPSV